MGVAIIYFINFHPCEQYTTTPLKYNIFSSQETNTSDILFWVVCIEWAAWKEFVRKLHNAYILLQIGVS